MEGALNATDVILAVMALLLFAGPSIVDIIRAIKEKR